jgi:dienelactone hydrolase
MTAAAVLLAATACSGSSSGEAAAPTPATTSSSPPKPTQPVADDDRRHRQTRTTELTGVRGQATLYEPAGPAPATAPVVLITQGTVAESYQAWIDHLVGDGSIVVFQNQSYSSIDLAARMDAPASGLQAAVAELRKPGHVRPRWDRLAMAGHSIGGLMSLQLAAETPRRKLPVPTGVFAVQPPAPDDTAAKLIAAVPARTRVVVLAGDRDDRVGDGPKEIWDLVEVRGSYVQVRSDEHGEPALVADHFFPLGGPADEPNALDRALWRVLDDITAGRPVGTDIGAWSDGTAIKPLEVINSA